MYPIQLSSDWMRLKADSTNSLPGIPDAPYRLHDIPKRFVSLIAGSMSCPFIRTVGLPGNR